MEQDTIIYLEDMYKMLHISKRKAKYMLDNGIIPCTDTKKKTHRYLIKKSDVIAFVEKGSVFQYPSNLFASGDPSNRTTNHLSSVVESDVAKKWYEKEFENEKDILQLKDVIRLTGFSDEAVRKWMQAGDLIGIQNGPYKVIPKLYLIKWMSSAKYLSRTQKSKLQIEQMEAMIKEKQQA